MFFLFSKGDERHADVYHYMVECDICHMSSIRGTRYKCTVCEDYDLCEKCMKKRLHEHDQFTAYTKPKEKVMLLFVV